MARLLFGLLLVLTALIQATVIPSLNPFLVSPDLVLVFLFVWSGSRSLRESLFWVFVAGILMDALALDPLGTNALALVGVPLLAGLARQRVLQANILIPMALIGITTVIHGLVLGLLRDDLPTPWFILWQSLMHMALIPVIYLVMRIFNR
ncbi:MAG TPA: rod shape-determining protein MreD [Thermomicrobiales bacterium]|nr:rod shape-determining protein MreD [Thermomicrobiales bacterium]